MTRYQKYYARGKARVVCEAIEFQFHVWEEGLAWWDIADYCEYFERVGRRFGLLREFRENGII